MDKKPMSGMAVRLETIGGERVGYASIPEARRSVSMEMPGGRADIVFSVSSKLESRASKIGEMDSWRVEVVANGDATRSFSTTYGMDIGHRTPVRDSLFVRESSVPTEPSARDVLMSLGMDVGMLQDMPRSRDAAMDYLRDELGFESNKKARETLDSLERLSDNVTRALEGRASLQDFAAWGRELENVSVPTRDTIALPRIERDGETYAGTVEVSVFDKKVRPGSMTVDGTPVEGTTHTALSFTANIVSKEGSDSRWEGVSSGQSIDTVREIWKDHPEVMELADLWGHWHLNGMRAGSRRQTDFLESEGKGRDYESSMAKLDAAGLNPDASFPGKDGKGYSYGSAWLVEPIPSETLARIEELRVLVPASAAAEAEPEVVPAP